MTIASAMLAILALGSGCSPKSVQPAGPKNQLKNQPENQHDGAEVPEQPGQAGQSRAQSTVATVGAHHGGHLILIGGGDRPDEVMRRFVSLASGPIVVLPLASAEPRETGIYYDQLLRQSGASEVAIVHIDQRSDAERAEVAEAISRARGVFFAGGDQRRITERMLDTAAHNALQAVLGRGGVIGGTSAGTACQSEIMLTGDGDFGVIRPANIVVTRGLALVAGVILDQHFVARQRNNRLISVVLEHQDQLGIGVDEATAAWFKPDRTLEVIGRSWVVVYDARDARVSRSAALLGVTGLIQHILVPGQRFDLTRRAVIAP